MSRVFLYIVAGLAIVATLALSVIAVVLHAGKTKAENESRTAAARAVKAAKNSIQNDEPKLPDNEQGS